MDGELVLADAEQALLDTASSEVVRHQQALHALEGQAEKTRMAIVEAGGRLRGSVNAVLALRGLSPDEYVATWDRNEGRVVISKIEKK